MFLAESFLTVGHDNSAPLLVQDFLRFHSARTTEQQKSLQHDWSVQLRKLLEMPEIKHIGGKRPYETFMKIHLYWDA